jgi:hypothetical protein
VATLEAETALAAGEVMAHWRVRRGEAAIALSGSDLVVVEETYRTPWQAPAALEPQAALALPDGAGGVVVHASLESPFSVQRAVASATGLDLNRVRVVQAVTGGGFGGKEESAAPPAAQAAVLALASGRPVRLLYTREEEMATASRRHPARIRLKLGATRDGHLFAAEVDVLLDGGAYATVSPAVLQRAAVHACGPYRVPNVKVDARVVRTHKTPAGSFRGLGVPQVAFAVESQMNLLAERLDMDPLELRRRNALSEGDETITGHRLTASAGLRDVLCPGGGDRGLVAEAEGLRDGDGAGTARHRPRRRVLRDRPRQPREARQPRGGEPHRVPRRERDGGSGHDRLRTGHVHSPRADRGGVAGVPGRARARGGERYVPRGGQRAHLREPGHRDERQRHP